MTLITCKICGSTFKKQSKHGHFKSKKHRHQWKFQNCLPLPIDVQKNILSYLEYFDDNGNNKNLPPLVTTIFKQPSFWQWGMNRSFYKLYLLPRYEILHAIYFRELFELKLAIKDEMEILIESYNDGTDNSKIKCLICESELQKWCRLFTPNKIMENSKKILFQQDINIFN